LTHSGHFTHEVVGHMSACQVKKSPPAKHRRPNNSATLPTTSRKQTAES